MREATFGGLKVRIAGGIDREGGGDGPVVILLHGFGAPGDDLVSVWRMLDVPDQIRFVFPVGPLALDLGFGGGRAWWMIDMERLLSGKERDAREIPQGLSESRGTILAFLEDLKGQLNVRPERIILGGFSQGAMLASDVVFRTDDPFAGLVIMSGTLLAKDEWASLIPKRKDLEVFQSHGRDDPLLPFGTAQQLRDLLKSGGVEVKWQEFRGGHEISPLVLEQLAGFIRARFSSPRAS